MVCYGCGKQRNELHPKKSDIDFIADEEEV